MMRMGYSGEARRWRAMQARVAMVRGRVSLDPPDDEGDDDREMRHIEMPRKDQILFGAAEPLQRSLIHYGNSKFMAGEDVPHHERPGFLFPFGPARETAAATFAKGRRHWLDDDEDTNVAAHEAGHIICAHFLLGQGSVRSATINAGPGFSGKMVTAAAIGELAATSAVICLAGNESERLFGGPADCGKRDLAEARAFAAMICQSQDSIDDLVKFARRSARRLLKDNFSSLISVTSALLSKRSLDAAEIDRIIARCRES